MKSANIIDAFISGKQSDENPSAPLTQLIVSEVPTLHLYIPENSTIFLYRRLTTPVNNTNTLTRTLLKIKQKTGFNRNR